MLADGEVIDIGGRRVRYIDTPHVPHGWDAGVIFEETTRTLFAGDLFAHYGRGPALTRSEIVGPATAGSDDINGATALTPTTGPTIRRLAALAPQTLAVMHGSSFIGDGAAQLHGLADFYERRQRAAMGIP
jgi:glyoxylase-like metal-dependent hydrolase (beta-lactamase superfamily II)